MLFRSFLVAPSDDGEGAARAMRAALDDASVAAEEIDYISAHATATQIGDLAETRAIRAVFGERAYQVPVSALTAITVSNSKQPLWNSPDGPAEAMKVEAGAFGFLKGGRNWLALKTHDALVVVRVDDEILGRVVAGVQERTGLVVARLAGPKE